ncbi:hypothetical protein ABK040_008486 [Willaertia magna]
MYFPLTVHPFNTFGKQEIKKFIEEEEHLKQFKSPSLAKVVSFSSTSSLTDLEEINNQMKLLNNYDSQQQSMVVGQPGKAINPQQLKEEEDNKKEVKKRQKFLFEDDEKEEEEEETTIIDDLATVKIDNNESTTNKREEIVSSLKKEKKKEVDYYNIIQDAGYDFISDVKQVCNFFYDTIIENNNPQKKCRKVKFNKNNQFKNSINDLPKEILQIIFNYLFYFKGNSLQQFNENYNQNNNTFLSLLLTCKEWNDIIIDNHYFWKERVIYLHYFLRKKKHLMLLENHLPFIGNSFQLKEFERMKIEQELEKKELEVNDLYERKRFWYYYWLCLLKEKSKRLKQMKQEHEWLLMFTVMIVLVYQIIRCLLRR